MSLFWTIILTVLGIFVLSIAICANAPNFYLMLGHISGNSIDRSYEDDTRLWNWGCSIEVMWRVLCVISAVCILLMAWARVPNLSQWSADIWPWVIFGGIFSPILIFVLYGILSICCAICSIIVHLFRLLYF